MWINIVKYSRIWFKRLQYFKTKKLQKETRRIKTIKLPNKIEFQDLNLNNWRRLKTKIINSRRNKYILIRKNIIFKKWTW
jgi:hypothetical protein